MINDTKGWGPKILWWNMHQTRHRNQQPQVHGFKIIVDQLHTCPQEIAIREKACTSIIINAPCFEHIYAMLYTHNMIYISAIIS
jgi:hypothetical protein